MNFVLTTDAFLLQHSEEVLTLEERHLELLSLSFYILLEYDLLEEVLRRLVRLKKVHHEHDHYLDRLLVQL